MLIYLLLKYKWSYASFWIDWFYGYYFVFKVHLLRLKHFAVDSYNITA